MKLLFDENLSPQLVRLLGDLYPGSAHVRDRGLQRTDDTLIWELAASEGFVVCTKDEDFYDRSVLRGHPPKVVRLVSGNGPTRAVAELLRRHSPTLHTFASDSTRSFLILGEG